MQIIVPMSGFGERFRRAGYRIPKPLIPVDGRPIITHVIDMFPGATDILFICDADHLAEPSFRMEEIILAHHPSARIVGIPSHEKGPIHAVLSARHEIDPDAPTIVNYCDFSCYWDYKDFRAFVQETDCDGAVPAYRGFHPHSLGATFYAYLQHDDLWASAIQEKKPFTDNPTSEFASSGTYYFLSGALMLDCFVEVEARNINVNGEHYVSLAYIPLFERRARVAIYELQHFLQWGTPEDLDEYQASSDLFAALTAQRRVARWSGLRLVPMAGAGKRFADAGYAQPKPLIPVSGRPMVVQATLDLPDSPASRFIVRDDLPSVAEITRIIAAEVPGASFISLKALTEGQAITCLAGLEGVADDMPVLIGACDNGMIYDADALGALLDHPGTDAIVFGYRGHPVARRAPHHFGWIDADAAGTVRRVSVKVTLNDPRRDPIVLGAFAFRRAGDFRRATQRMVAENRRINNEFYVDEAMNLAVEDGLKVRLFEVQHFVGWGTPNELRSFEYWQSCFHKLAHHPYDLSKDARIPEKVRAALAARYRARVPARPGRGSAR